MRTFIAIELTSEPQAALVALQTELKKVLAPAWIRWTTPKNIHLTLHFLGELTPPQVEAIVPIVTEGVTPLPAFKVRLNQLGCFPNPTRPHVVLITVSGQLAPLHQLHQHLGQQLQASIGFQVETRPYQPHLTLGRVRDNVPSAELRQLGQAVMAFKPHEALPTFTVNSITLMKSELRPQGPLYTPLAHGKLLG